MRFLRFLRRSFTRGLSWLVRVSNPALDVVGLLALLGLATVVFKVTNLPLWLLIPGATTVVWILFAVGAYKEWDEADRRAPASLGLEASPNPMTVLTWSNGDYHPRSAKGWPGPKTFLGPTNPDMVEGVKTNDYDSWHFVDSTSQAPGQPEP